MLSQLVEMRLLVRPCHCITEVILDQSASPPGHIVPYRPATRLPRGSGPVASYVCPLYVYRLVTYGAKPVFATCLSPVLGAFATAPPVSSRASLVTTLSAT